MRKAPATSAQKAASHSEVKDTDVIVPGRVTAGISLILCVLERDGSDRPGSDGHPRPYLWLTLKGPRGGPEVPIVGLVDTGADKSVLPIDYAQLIGIARRPRPVVAR